MTTTAKKSSSGSTLFEYKSVYMQRIIDYVRRGYVFYVHGEVSTQKLSSLRRKFAAKYGTEAGKYERVKRKGLGLANAVLLTYRAEVANETAVHWVLLITDGDSLARSEERLGDARTSSSRLTFKDFELVQLPRSGQSAPAWTWRFRRTRYEGLRDQIVYVSKRDPALLSSLFHSLQKTPGFAGCRKQLKALQKLANGSLKRYQCDTQPLKFKFYYLRRLANKETAQPQ